MCCFSSQKRLNKWTSLEKTQMWWCVGGSLAATHAGRDETGRMPLIKLVVCRQDGWPGRGTRSNKVGDTCKVHCAGVRFENTNMNGTFYDHIVLKKCTWLRCCYGKKPYGNPPDVPWCNTCEYQKRLVRAIVTVSSDSVHLDSCELIDARSTESPGES